MLMSKTYFILNIILAIPHFTFFAFLYTQEAIVNRQCKKPTNTNPSIHQQPSKLNANFLLDLLQFMLAAVNKV